MGISVDRLKARLRKEEGLMTRPYWCPAGKKTIGYGWNIDARGLPDYIDHHVALHGCITEEMAEYLLDMAIVDSVAAARRYAGEVWNALTAKRREALTEMAFVLGEAGLCKFTTLRRCLDAQDYHGAARAIRQSLWAKQAPRRVEELARIMEAG